jgi:branched-chain amino acid transport system substrate-binding protein
MSLGRFRPRQAGPHARGQHDSKEGKRVTRVVGAFAVAGLLVAAGCSSSSASSTTTTAAGGTTTGSKAPLEIGGVYSVTGVLSAFAGDLINGLKFYSSQTDAAGGIDGHQVQVVIKDDQSQANVGVTVMRELASDSSIMATSGPVLPGEGELLAEVAASSHVPLVSFLLSVPDSDFNSNAYWYRLAWSDNKTVDAVLSELKALGDTKIAVLYADDAGGQPGDQAVDALAPSLGMQVVSQHSYPTGTPDPTVQVLGAISSHPQAYVVWDPDSSTELGLVVRTLRENGATQPIGAPESASASAFVQAAGSTVSGVYYWGGVAPDDLAPGLQTTVGDAMAAAGLHSTDFTFAGYAIGQIIGAAAAKVYSSGQTLTRSNLNSTIASLQGLATVYGTVNYSTSNHAEPLSTVPIIEYVNGRTTLIGRR